jgi:hypothetical protein
MKMGRKGCPRNVGKLPKYAVLPPKRAKVFQYQISRQSDQRERTDTCGQTGKKKQRGGVRDYAKASNENRWMSATIFIPTPYMQPELKPYLKCISKFSSKNHVTSNGGNNVL